MNYIIHLQTKVSMEKIQVHNFDLVSELNEKFTANYRHIAVLHKTQTFLCGKVFVVS
jgi:hypothetical protein